MEQDIIGKRQLSIIAFIGVLAPLIRLLPRASVAFAGRAAWLSPLVAIPFGIAYFVILRIFVKNRKEGEGLYQLSQRAVGKFLGAAFSVLCGVWLVVYAGFIARSAAERLISCAYGEAKPGVFVTVLILSAAWAAMGGVRKIARTAEIFEYIIVLAFALALVFSATEVRNDYLLPVTYLDAEGIALGALPVIEVLGVTSYFLFLLNKVEVAKQGDGGSLIRFFLLILVALGVLVVTIGACSEAVVIRLQYPFFIIMRNVELPGIAQRIESLLIAIWILTDFVLLTAIFKVIGEIFSALFKKSAMKAVVIVSAVLALLTAFKISDNAFDLQVWSMILVPGINMVITLVLLPGIVVIGKIRKIF